MESKNKKLALVVIDGWGVAPSSEFNPVNPTNCPFYFNLAKSFPSTVLKSLIQDGSTFITSTKYCSSSYFAMGTSNIQLDSIGSINEAIINKKLAEESAIKEVFNHAQKNSSALHLIGQLSEGKKNSSLEHLKYLLLLAKKKRIEKVFVHAILDGIDTPPMSGKKYLQEIMEFMEKQKVGRLSSLIGRYYAMDRSGHYDRTKKFYSLLTEGRGKSVNDIFLFLKQCYDKKIFEEEIQPIVLNHGKVSSGDSLLFFNTRSDRIRQILQALAHPDFEEFKVFPLNNLKIATFSQYSENGVLRVGSPENECLSVFDILVSAGIKISLLSSPGKRAFIEYCFNGNKLLKNKILSFDFQNKFFEKEQNYDSEMVDSYVKLIKKKDSQFITLVLSSPDETARLSDFNTAIETAKNIDKLLGKIYKNSLKYGFNVIICSNHGTFENPKNYHEDSDELCYSQNPVPFLIIDKDFEGKRLGFDEVPSGDLGLIKPVGSIIDIAPTILKYLGLDVPAKMKGKSII